MAPKGEGVDKVYQDRLVSVNQRMQRHEDLDGQFNKTFETFTQQMAKPGVLGIPQLNEDGFVTSYALDSKAIKLSNTSFDFKYSQDCMPVDCSACPVALNFASRAETQSYYDGIFGDENNDECECNSLTRNLH